MPLEFFKKKIGKQVTYSTPQGLKITVDVTEDNFSVLFNMQNMGYNFKSGVFEDVAKRYGNAIKRLAKVD